MAYESLNEIKKLIEHKIEGKRPKRDEFKPLLKIIAETGFLPYNEDSLNKAIDILFHDVDNCRKGKESKIKYYNYKGQTECYPIYPVCHNLRLSDVDNFIIDAGVKNNLIATPEQIVKRVFSRCGCEEFENKALEILQKVKNETKTSPRILAAAVSYIGSEKNLIQKDVSEYCGCTEISTRIAYHNIIRRHPEYSINKRSRLSKVSN